MNYDILTAENADDDNTQCYAFIHFVVFALRSETCYRFRIESFD